MSNKNYFRITIFMLVIIFLNTNINAQNCGFDDSFNHFDSKITKMDSIIRSSLYLDNNKPNTNQRKSFGCSSSSSVLKIPIVFHLVYSSVTGGNANFSDAYITTLLSEINARFRHASNMTFANSFSGINTEIQFEFAKRDPSGNTTTGITRHAIGLYSTVTGAAIRDTLSRRYHWSTNLYTNIYIVDVLADASGIATMPYSVGSYYDWVFLDAGITWSGLAAHELGHYLGLYHTFEITNLDRCYNYNCETDGDQICDTPVKSISGFGGGNCNNPRNTCTTDSLDTDIRNPYRPRTLGGTGMAKDMLENYMDYTGGCWAAFTKGQSRRMRTTLLSVRKELLNSVGKIPVNSTETELTEVLQPYDVFQCSKNATIRIKMKNIGIQPVSTFQVSVIVNGTTNYTETCQVISISGNNYMLTIGGIALQEGVNTLYITSSATGETFLSNNSDCFEVNYNSLNKKTDTTTFENNSTNNWLTISDLSTSGFNINTISGCTNNESKVLAYTSYLQNQGTGFTARIISPTINLTGITSAGFSFNYAYQSGYNNYPTVFQVQYSEDCGNTFTILSSKTKNSLNTSSFFNPNVAYIPNACSEWRTENFNLTSLAGKNIILKLEMQLTSGTGHNFYLDNFKITAGSTLTGMVTFSGINTSTGINTITGINTSTGLNSKTLPSIIPTIYPNPSYDSFNVQNLDNKAIDIKIYDQLGNLMIYKSILPNEILNFGFELPLGMYFANSGGYYTKIIKQ